MRNFDLRVDISAALAAYPLLRLKEEQNGTLSLSGRIELSAPDGSLLESFAIDVCFPEAFPSCFPKVFENGEKIERTMARHVNTSDNSLCLAVPAEELLLCMDGITTRSFLDDILCPRLAEEVIVLNGGSYQREYSHGGANGQWEFYSKALRSTSRKTILRMLGAIVRGEMPRGSGSCACGSGYKFKKCHMKEMVRVSSLGKAFLSHEMAGLHRNAYTSNKILLTE